MVSPTLKQGACRNALPRRRKPGQRPPSNEEDILPFANFALSDSTLFCYLTWEE